jgi:hypothetical protein
MVSNNIMDGKDKTVVKPGKSCGLVEGCCIVLGSKYPARFADQQIRVASLGDSFRFGRGSSSSTSQVQQGFAD